MDEILKTIHKKVHLSDGNAYKLEIVVMTNGVMTAKTYGNIYSVSFDRGKNEYHINLKYGLYRF